MFDIGWSELLIVGVVAVVAIGPKELPNTMRSLGRGVNKMRRMAGEFQGQFNQALKEANLEDVKKEFDVLRVIEWTESLRDLNTTMLETNLLVQSNQMNLIVKKVTSWAAIIAVPTAVTGFYGQNVPYPGYGKHWGFVVSLGILIATALALYAIFKKRDWL